MQLDVANARAISVKTDILRNGRRSWAESVSELEASSHR